MRPLIMPSIAVPASRRAWRGEVSSGSSSIARDRNPSPSAAWPRRNHWRAMAAASRRPCPARSRLWRQAPSQRRVEVRAVALQQGSPVVLVGVQARLGLLGEGQEIVQVPVPQVFGLTGGPQLLRGVLADRVQHPVADLTLDLVRGDQRGVQQSVR